MLGAVDQGLISAVLALGVFLTFRILNFADLTVDGSFVTGGATSAIIIFNGHSPILATVAGMFAGAAAGGLTGLLHTKLHVDPLLASILVMLGMYTINSHIMWLGKDGQHRSNVSLLSKTTLFTWLPDQFAHLSTHLANLSHRWHWLSWLLSWLSNQFAWVARQDMNATWTSVVTIGIGVVIVVLIVNWFLSTRFGLAVMATGDNPDMASSMGISIDFTKIVTLMISNGLVGLSGALWAQNAGYSAITDGTGMILIGLASVILGNAIFGTRFLWLATIGVVVGAVLYRVAIYLALQWNYIDAVDMKLTSALLVIVALVLSQSKGAHALVTRLSPWRRKPSIPEPMSVVPNEFSPFAEVDAATPIEIGQPEAGNQPAPDLPAPPAELEPNDRSAS